MLQGRKARRRKMVYLLLMANSHRVRRPGKLDLDHPNDVLDVLLPSNYFEYSGSVLGANFMAGMIFQKIVESVLQRVIALITRLSMAQD